MRLTLPALLLAALCVSVSAEDSTQPWITLFDGKSLDGWKINENPETWKLADGVLTCNGEKSHIFYVGEQAPFKNFEFEAEVMTQPNSNSGIYFHTTFQESDWPKAGFECQVNNTYEKDPKKTASLYGVQNILEQVAQDNEWFTYNIRVVGKTVTITINGKKVNEYTEPAEAKPTEKFDRVLGQGTFALQGHDPHSTVSYRNIRVRKLDAPTPETKKESPVAFYADDAKTGVKVGDAAPSFTLKDDQGKDWKSDDHFKSGITVVYFYPADFTGGCTKQACSYRDDFSKLKDLGVNVVGISGDSVATHQKFKAHHGLNFTLLSDAKGEAATKFGVPVTLGEKTAMFEGQTFVRTATAQRWTYVVKDGKVAMVNDKVNAAGDSAAIQEAVKKLQ